MSNILSFLNKKKIKGKTSPDAKTVKLWNFSMDVDELLKKAVHESNISPDEVATVLSHRLASLLLCCENSENLKDFCLYMIEKVYREKKEAQDINKGAS